MGIRGGYAPPGVFLPSYGHSQDFTLKQNDTLPISSPGWPIRAIAVFNPTPFYIHVLDLPLAMAWVGPQTQGAILAIPADMSSIHIVSTDVPAGQPAVPASSLLAVITCLEAQLPPSPGSPIQVLPPWQLPNKPMVFRQQAGLGTTTVVTPVAGQNVYVFGGVLDVYGAAAGGFAALTDDGGNVLVQTFGDSQHSVPFSLFGAAVGLGKGLSLKVVVAACSAEVSVGYSQA
jgi:hypothetical protein